MFNVQSMTAPYVSRSAAERWAAAEANVRRCAVWLVKDDAGNWGLENAPDGPVGAAPSGAVGLFRPSRETNR